MALSVHKFFNYLSTHYIHTYKDSNAHNTKTIMPSALHKMATTDGHTASKIKQPQFSNVFLAFFSVTVSSLREVSRKLKSFNTMWYY